MSFRAQHQRIWFLIFININDTLRAHTHANLGLASAAKGAECGEITHQSATDPNSLASPQGTYFSSRPLLAIKIRSLLDL